MSKHHADDGGAGRNEDFDWEYADRDREKAMDGLEDNTYSMMIDITSDLS